MKNLVNKIFVFAVMLISTEDSFGSNLKRSLSFPSIRSQVDAVPVRRVSSQTAFGTPRQTVFSQIPDDIMRKMFGEHLSLEDLLSFRLTSRSGRNSTTTANMKGLEREMRRATKLHNQPMSQFVEGKIDLGEFLERAPRVQQPLKDRTINVASSVAMDVTQIPDALVTSQMRNPIRDFMDRYPGRKLYLDGHSVVTEAVVEIHSISGAKQYAQSLLDKNTIFFDFDNLPGSKNHVDKSRAVLMTSRTYEYKEKQISSLGIEFLKEIGRKVSPMDRVIVPRKEKIGQTGFERASLPQLMPKQVYLPIHAGSTERAKPMIHRVIFEDGQHGIVLDKRVKPVLEAFIKDDNRRTFTVREAFVGSKLPLD